MLYFGDTSLLLAVAGFVGKWGAGILLIAIWVLMVLEIIFHFIISPPKPIEKGDGDSD